MDDFIELGPDFIKEYKDKKIQNLEGFGRALAIATFIYDFDCIGNSGGNMGYIEENGQKIIVKIDPGEALPFLTDMKSADGIKHDPKSRDMIIGTNNTKIAFS